jgi:ClpP class serine protease
MWKNIIIGTALGLFLVSCAAMPTGQTRPPQEVVVKVEATNPTNVKIKQENNEDRVNRSMEVPNQEGHLSQLSFISKNRAFVKIFSGLSVSDVTRLWNDLVVLENNTKIRDVSLFINSPGGDAFSGLALADQIERARRKGFRITAFYGS